MYEMLPNSSTQHICLVGNVGLDDDIGRYFSQSTGLNPLRLVNPEITEQHAGHARAGVNLNTFRYRSPVGFRGTPWLGLVR